MLPILLLVLLAPRATSAAPTHRLLLPVVALRDALPMAVVSFRYASSVDPIDDLYARCADPGGADRPVVALMHGYSQQAHDVPDAVLARIARRGLVACAFGMRGRDGAAGTPDASGREVMDVVDGVRAARARVPSASPDRAVCAGYSGGGGNCLAAAAKFPDFWTDVADHFGISDYGADPAWGWAQDGTARGATLAWLGDPATNADAYRARDHARCVPNLAGGFLYVFHDREDHDVGVEQSLHVAAVLGALGRTNYAVSITGPGDDPRWSHGLPTGPLAATEDAWAAAAASRAHAPWTVPARGTLRVCGYVVTKRFSVWLGDGTRAVADLDYDAEARTYSLAFRTAPADARVAWR